MPTGHPRRVPEDEAATPDQVETAIEALTDSAHSPEVVYADQWLARTARHSYRVQEDSIKGPAGQILTLIWWRDEVPLIKLQEAEEQRAGRRSDWKQD